MEPLGPGEPAQAGRYRLLATVGEGAMGRVLLGVAPDGRLAAVKRVHRQFAHDAGFRERFRREVDVSRLVSGAYTAAVMDADPDAAAPWLASVFVAGPSLQDAVDATGPLPVDAVRQLAAGLASALAGIHRAGLVHRDLKPSNVLLAEDGPRVIDFGIARAAEGGTDLTHTGAILGSPAFMSPEQAEGRPLTPASDVFSLGALLVLAATGRSPFAGASAPQSLYNVVHTHPDLRILPPDVRALAEPCLAKDPAQRPSPAQILEFLGPLPPVPRPWPPAVHALIAHRQTEVRDALAKPPKPRRRGLRIALAAVAAVVVIGGTITTVALTRNAPATTASPPTTPVTATTTSAPNPDPLGPDRLRGVDLCKVLPSAPGVGPLTPKIDVHLFSCTYETARRQWLDLTIGGPVAAKGTPAGDLDGLPLSVEEKAGGCTAAVPVADRADTTIGVEAEGSAEKFDKPCDVAKAALGEALKRLRDTTPAPPAGSLAAIDPCPLVPAATAQRIVGPVTKVEPRGLHECQWHVAGDVTVTLERGVPPFRTTDSYYDTSTTADLDGVTAFVTTKRANAARVSCTYTWRHRPYDDRTSENVIVDYTTSASSLTVEDTCRQAQDFAKTVKSGLPKP
ncbi:serine/threonine-protein kinase [Amycolatopsis sp. WQ 127309]|uniref:serine/threonine-protein kinase n=1 Tax=Amycolatopsis sp. WQ 127309 TaxID=2932773 RepID=UPI001FF6A178|nr:serine/threonine-protein kinase [Amycolatopsis sp. WQ 127309]UOZ05028.1 serine/threonine protein kinase [Amycolatopsis sp. WQ 127309]